MIEIAFYNFQRRGLALVSLDLRVLLYREFVFVLLEVRVSQSLRPVRHGNSGFEGVRTDGTSKRTKK
jgi:hypothetical protein